jgi:hypothetical protein
MTLTTDPDIMTTSSGALLPLVALPQGELLTVNEANLPPFERLGNSPSAAKILLDPTSSRR